MIYLFGSYIKFLLKSTNQHGVHSPFVYNLVTRCFYDKTSFPEYQIVRTYKNEILKNNQSITVKDLGAGSRVFTSNQRMISAIAKHAGITFKRQKLLFRMMRYFKPDSVLELGTSLGMATWAMALANPPATIYTVEGCKATSEVAKSYFKKFQFKNIRLYNQTFTAFFENFPQSKIDFVYLDGSHDKESTLALFNQLLPHAHNNSVFIFDDIYWSKEMTEAWKEIIKHPKITVSIDTYFWGLVFFRKEQKKQHFTIRV